MCRPGWARSHISSGNISVGGADPGLMHIEPCFVGLGRILGKTNAVNSTGNLRYLFCSGTQSVCEIYFGSMPLLHIVSVTGIGETTVVHTPNLITEYIVLCLNNSVTLLINMLQLYLRNTSVILCCMQDEPQRADSYRYAVQPRLVSDDRSERIEALKRKRKLKKTKEELETLKDELDMVSKSPA